MWSILRLRQFSLKDDRWLQVPVDTSSKVLGVVRAKEGHIHGREKGRVSFAHHSNNVEYLEA